MSLIKIWIKFFNILSMLPWSNIWEVLPVNILNKTFKITMKSNSKHQINLYDYLSNINILNILNKHKSSVPQVQVQLSGKDPIRR
jgi:hypothetical protein